MKKHYDFSGGEQGKLHRSAKSLRVPIYLDQDVQRKLVGADRAASRNLSKLVNTILRSQIGVADLLK